MIQCFFLISRQGKVRLTKWYTTVLSTKEKLKFIKEINSQVLTRSPKLCNFMDYNEYKIIYKRYASLFFIMVVDKDDNELLGLEIIHQYVELLDTYFGNVCELDIIFNFHKAYFILDEMIMGGIMSESSRRVVLKQVKVQEAMLVKNESEEEN